VVTILGSVTLSGSLVLFYIYDLLLMPKNIYTGNHDVIVDDNAVMYTNERC
jgi:hypothetical protein